MKGGYCTYLCTVCILTGDVLHQEEGGGAEGG